MVQRALFLSALLLFGAVAVLVPPVVPRSVAVTSFEAAATTPPRARGTAPRRGRARQQTTRANAGQAANPGNSSANQGRRAGRRLNQENAIGSLANRPAGDRGAFVLNSNAGTSASGPSANRRVGNYQLGITVVTAVPGGAGRQRDQAPRRTRRNGENTTVAGFQQTNGGNRAVRNNQNGEAQGRRARRGQTGRQARNMVNGQQSGARIGVNLGAGSMVPPNTPAATGQTRTRTGARGQRVTTTNARTHASVGASTVLTRQAMGGS